MRVEEDMEALRVGTEGIGAGNTWLDNPRDRDFEALYPTRQ